MEFGRTGVLNEGEFGGGHGGSKLANLPAQMASMWTWSV